MSVIETINFEYGNVNNIYNPILKDILTNLDEFGFLDNLTVARDATSGSIKTYKNLEGRENHAAALEIIVDCISRGLMKAYQDGFVQGITSDGSSNIGYSSEVILPSINIAMASNTHEAITLLANEIQVIKATLVTLGKPLPPLPVVPSIKANIK